MFQGPRQIVDVTVRSPASMSTRGVPRVVGGEKDNLSVLLYDTFDTEAVQNRILGAVGTSVTSAVFMSPPPPVPKVSRKHLILKKILQKVGGEETLRCGRC